MPKYRVHVYREMRIVFDEIEAATPDEAAQIAGEKDFDERDEWGDCEGRNIAALVDYAPHEGTLVNFEAGRMLDAGPILLEALRSARATIAALQADVDSFRAEVKDPATYDVGEAEYNTRETVNAIDEALANAAGVSPEPTPTTAIAGAIGGAS